MYANEGVTIMSVDVTCSCLNVWIYIVSLIKCRNEKYKITVMSFDHYASYGILLTMTKVYRGKWTVRMSLLGKTKNYSFPRVKTCYLFSWLIQ